MPCSKASITYCINFPFDGLFQSPGIESSNHLDFYNLMSSLQSRTKLLEKVSPIMSTFPRNKTISKTTPLRKENPFPNSMLLPTNAQGSGFLLNTQQHCFQGKGQREESVQLRCLEKCCPSIQFSQQFCLRLQQVREKENSLKQLKQEAHNVQALSQVQETMANFF